MQTVEERLRTLMIEALAGNEASYRLLLTALDRTLRSYYGRRLGSDHADVDDLVQDTLMAVHARRFTYDVERPFTAWLHAIARYKLIDRLRKAGGRRDLPIEDRDDLFTPDETEAAGARFDVGRLLNSIPAKPRELIRAVKLEGRSVAEVSAASGLSESAVKIAIHRALKVLSQRLKATRTK